MGIFVVCIQLLKMYGNRIGLLERFVDLVASEQRCNLVLVRWLVDVGDQLDSLERSVMELVAESQLEGFDIHDYSFQVFPYFRLSFAMCLGLIEVVLVVLSLVAVQQHLAELASDWNQKCTH